MRFWQKAISSLLTCALLLTLPAQVDSASYLHPPQRSQGYAYTDQTCILPNGCFLLFVMVFGAGIGAWLLLKSSSGHAHSNG